MASMASRAGWLRVFAPATVAITLMLVVRPLRLRLLALFAADARLSDAKWQALARQRKLRDVGERCRAARDGDCSGSPCKSSASGCDPPALPSDVLVHILVQLPLTGRLRAASVCKDWQRAASTPALYAQINRASLADLGRRIPRAVLFSIAAHCVSSATCELDLRGITHLTDELVGLLTAPAPALRILDLSASPVGDAALASAAEHCPLLEQLRLWAVDDITDAGLSAIADAGGLALEALDVRACSELTDEGLVPLMASCGMRLRELRLKGVSASVGDPTLAALGAHCPNLAILDASGLTITDAGVRALADGCTQLSHIFLAGCKRVGNEGVSALAANCGERLRLLDLQGCSTVGDVAALRLAECCPSLSTVSFQCCPGLTDTGFAALVEHCPLMHVTLKHCKVSQDSVLQAQRAHPSLQVRTIRSGLQWETV